MSTTPKAELTYEAINTAYHKVWSIDPSANRLFRFAREIETLCAALTQPPEQQAEPVGAGVELAARWVEKRLEDYDAEHGSTDPETGTREYPGRGAGDEYVGELQEIIEGIRSLAHPQPPAAAAVEVPAGVPNLNLAWACESWRDQVQNRPLVNVHRRTLDSVWRQVIRHFGGDPIELLGPAHDELVSTAPLKPRRGGSTMSDYQRILDDAERMTSRWKTSEEVMTLRDQFAVAALQGQMAGIEWKLTGRPVPPKQAAELALDSYQIADAMLKARQP